MSKKAVKEKAAPAAEDIPLRAEDMDPPEKKAPESAPKRDAATLEKAVSELEQALEKAQADASGHWDRLLRKEAELQNIQRRAEQNVSEARQFALKGFILDLLSVMDSFDQGMALTEKADPALAEGMKLTHQQMVNTLEKYGVSILDPVGEPFNPQSHEALTMQPSEECPPNHIIAVVQKGYRLHDRVIRPAKVIISKPA
ncbi:MAG: nucleotide exchange factor GrpE [Legionellales bacterium]|nr:nucleotide exchange factor GrpE [Legionellales bacterium]|tara:strand:+ start:2334 stop:2933 length:600 start_codon:yes stop_codon:yes gene_type:complete